jgi:hypothetical protein
VRALVLLLAVAAAAASCSASKHVSGSATVTQTSTETVGDVGDPLAKRAVAPTLWFHARAGTIRATRGSSCVQYTDPKTGEGTGVCADTPYPAPHELVIVRPRERVRFGLRGGRGFLVEVHRFGCERRTIARIRIAPDGRWRVALRPGLYELLVHVGKFDLGRRHGDVSGGVGLWVSRHKRRDIFPAASVYAPGC